MVKQVIMLLFLSAATFLRGNKPITEVTIAWEDGLKPPYLMLDQNNQPVGIMVELLEEILKRANIKPQHLIVPWKRCLFLIENKMVDIVPNSSYKEERAQFAYYTKQIYETHRYLFYLKNRFSVPPVINTLAELEKYRIGGILGFNYDHLGPNIKIDDGAKNHENLIEKLKSGRFDFAEEQLEVILYMANQSYIDLNGLGYMPTPGNDVKAYYTLTAKTDKGLQLREIIDKGLDALTKDGSAGKIVAKYLGKI